MSRITTSVVAVGVPDATEFAPVDEPSTPAKKPSKPDAAKADVAAETEETP